jgi:hypothetical protein
LLTSYFRHQVLCENTNMLGDGSLLCIYVVSWMCLTRRRAQIQLWELGTSKSCTLSISDVYVMLCIRVYAASYVCVCATQIKTLFLCFFIMLSIHTFR